MTFDRAATISRLMAAFNARDLDAWMADCTERVEVESRFSSVAGTVFRGREGVASWWRDLAEAWDSIQVELEGHGDIDTGRTAVLMTIHTKGRESGLELHDPVALRWQWRGERLARMQYMDRREAELIIERCE